MTNRQTDEVRGDSSWLIGSDGLPEEFFRHVLRTHPDSISITRLSDGKFLDVSRGFERMTGLTREEAIGRTAEELGLYNDVPGGRAAVYERLANEGIVRDLRVRLRTRNGDKRYLRVSIDRIRLNGHDWSLTIARDSTDEENAEDRTRESEMLLRNIMDASPNSVFVKDRDGYYVLVNKAMAERNNLTPEEMVGMRDLDVGASWFHPALTLSATAAGSSR